MTKYSIHRKDTNHDDIKRACEMYGMVVINTSQGNDMLDLYIYNPKRPHLWYFLEVKSGKYWKLSSRESKFILDHPEHSRIVESAGDIQLLMSGKLPQETAIREATWRLT